MSKTLMACCLRGATSGTPLRVSKNFSARRDPIYTIPPPPHKALQTDITARKKAVSPQGADGIFSTFVVSRQRPR